MGRRRTGSHAGVEGQGANGDHSGFVDGFCRHGIGVSGKNERPHSTPRPATDDRSSSKLVDGIVRAVFRSLFIQASTRLETRLETNMRVV